MNVKRGDIFLLGRHRLMCGDATNAEDVRALFAGARPNLVVTSPPYADARDYNDPIACWDSMMLGAFDGHDFADDVQMLVNLGPIHRKGEWVPYWHNWLTQMRARKWKVFAQYVWDKAMAVAGSFGGRLCPAHEYVFHLNKKRAPINKCAPCKYAGRNQTLGRVGVRDKTGQPRKRAATPVQKYKVPGSVMYATPVHRSEASGHPAQMSKAIAQKLIRPWKSYTSLAYDPFCGSGTTLHACEQENIAGLGMEISPEYVSIAIKRWDKAQPNSVARKA